MAPFEVPVTPGAEEAQRAAREELERAIYHQEPGLISRFFDWVTRHLTDIFSGGFTGAGSLLPFLILAVLLALGLVAIMFASRVRSDRRASVRRGASSAVFVDDADSRTLAERARRAAAAGDYTLAFLEQFRALIRAADERALIEDRPGLTAQEAAALLGAVLPGHARAIRTQAGIFDAGTYGATVLSAQHFAALAELSAAVHTALTAGAAA